MLIYLRTFTVRKAVLFISPPHILAKVESDSENIPDTIPRICLGEINMRILAMLSNLDLFDWKEN